MWSQGRGYSTWERNEFHGSCSRALSPTCAGSQHEQVPSLLPLRWNYLLISPELIFLLSKFSLSLCLSFPFSALTFCSVQLELATEFQQWVQDVRPNFFLKWKLFEASVHFLNFQMGQVFQSIVMQKWKYLYLYLSLYTSYSPIIHKGRKSQEDNLSFKNQNWGRLLFFPRVAKFIALFSVKT